MTRTTKYSFILLLFIALPFAFSSCHNDHLTACFSVDKKVAYAGDTLSFTNCSDYDGTTESERWDFGDGSDIVYRYYKGSITHIYDSTGKFSVNLSIGADEEGDDVTDTVTIN